MNRRAFLKWFGIGVPAAVVATVVVPKLSAHVPETVSAKLGEWNNFYSEGDEELMKYIENWKSHPVHHTTTLETPKVLKAQAIYYDKEFMQGMKADLAQFEEIMRSRKAVPIHMDVKRNFFVYNTKS